MQEKNKSSFENTKQITTILTKIILKQKIDSSELETLYNYTKSLLEKCTNTEEYKVYFNHLQVVVNNGHPKAQYDLGMFFLQLNDISSIKYFEKSAEQGNVLSLIALGNIYKKGATFKDGIIKKNYEKSKYYFEKAEFISRSNGDISNNTNAKFELAKLFFDKYNENTTQDKKPNAEELEIAFNLFNEISRTSEKQAKQAKNILDCKLIHLLLGLEYYYGGNGLEKDNNKSLSLISEATNSTVEQVKIRAGQLKQEIENGNVIEVIEITQIAINDLEVEQNTQTRGNNNRSGRGGGSGRTKNS